MCKDELWNDTADEPGNALVQGGDELQNTADELSKALVEREVY